MHVDPVHSEVGRLPDPTEKKKKKPTLPHELWTEASEGRLKILSRMKQPTPYSGRSVTVQRAGPFRDAWQEPFNSAYRRLQNILRENTVAKTARSQERHEKKGVKRRRLASQTHRRKFAQLVRQKVALVQKYRARGS